MDAIPSAINDALNEKAGQRSQRSRPQFFQRAPKVDAMNVPSAQPIRNAILPLAPAALSRKYGRNCTAEIDAFEALDDDETVTPPPRAASPWVNAPSIPATRTTIEALTQLAEMLSMSETKALEHIVTTARDRRVSAEKRRDKATPEPVTAVLIDGLQPMQWQRCIRSIKWLPRRAKSNAHVLVSWMKKNKTTAFPEIGTLATATGSSRRTVQRGMKVLEDAGCLVVEGRKSKSGDNTSNLYRIAVPEPIADAIRARVESGGKLTKFADDGMPI